LQLPAPVGQTPRVAWFALLGGALVMPELD
jgi:hypothetical protein